MNTGRALTEVRLKEALERLLDGNPRHVKATGRLTLNKINNEARLGNSYIHKFPEFLIYSKPIIEKYNFDREKISTTDLSVEIEAPLSEVNTFKSEIDGLRSDLSRERKLKEKYRLERDDAIKAKKFLEAELYEIMFISLELQNEILALKPVAYINSKA